MSDPLSIAGTVAGLVSLALQLSQEAYRYVSGVKDASSTLSSFVQQLSALQNVFLGIQKALEDQVKHPNDTIRARKPDISETALKDCIHELQKAKAHLASKLGKGGLMGKLYAITWPFQEKEFEKKVQILSHFNDIFSTALGTETYAIASANLSEIIKQREANYWEKVVEWFRPATGHQIDKSIIDNKCPGTGNSVLSDASFLQWKTGGDNLLWGFGQPVGAGKTTVAATVLDALRSTNHMPAIVTYHFFVVDSEEQVAGSFRQLVYRALKQYSDKVPLASEIYERFENFNATLPVKDIVEVLLAIATSGKRLFIVLDAIDECRDVPELMRYLPLLTGSDIKVFATSRDLPNIRKHLGESLKIEIRTDTDEMQKYVDWRLHSHDIIEFDSFKGHLENEIVEKLSHHIDGSFLLARLSMDHICSLSTITEIRNCFENLPTDYRSAYQNTLRRILDQAPLKRQLAQRSLLWVVYAQRTLTMTELLCALGEGEETKIVDDVDFDNAARSILSACIGLLRLSKTDQKVHMVHSSAKAFLRDEGGILSLDAHTHIFEVCLAYMSSMEMAKGACLCLNSLEDRLRRFPFFQYAARYYGYHAQTITTNNETRLKAFLLEKNFRESSWQALHFVFQPIHNLRAEQFANIPTHPTLLHVAAYWGWSQSLADVTRNSPSLDVSEIADINIVDSHGWTPLHWASSMGHNTTVKTLCDLGATVDKLDSTNWTPLFWASIKGYEQIVSELISEGANVYHTDIFGMTASHWSLIAGQVTVTGLLLEHEAQYPLAELDDKLSAHPNVKDMSISQIRPVVALYQTGRSIFHLSAAFLDSQKFSDFLLHGLNRAQRSKYWHQGAPGYDYIEPLYRIFWKIHDKSDVQAVAGLKDEKPLLMFQDLLLKYAVESEHVQLVEALLKFEERSGQQKIEAFWGPNRTYLYDTAGYRSPAIVRMLLSYRDDIDTDSLLHHACASGSVAVVKALLDIGNIRIDSTSSPVISLLKYGAWRTQHYPDENREILLTLLENGASLDVLDEDGNNPTNLAMRLWDVGVLELLTQQRVSFNTRNMSGMNTLHHLAVAPLEMSAKRQRRDFSFNLPSYTIPLTAIEGTLKFVIEKCEPHAMENEAQQWLSYSSSRTGRTPLVFTIMSNNWPLVDRLIAKQPKLEMGMPTVSLLKRAISAGHLGTVDLLLRHKGNSLEDFCAKHLDLEKVMINQVSCANLLSTENPPYSFGHLFSPNYLSVLERITQAGGDTFKEGDKTRKALGKGIDLGVEFGILKLLLDAGVDPSIPALNGFNLRF
ncbi:hypothetical protein F5Y03DRAFT_261558 [Xylaria venustula]|nr:hypothetical protein F5Y03DRAFT_261558 [Xylaria venustula]